MPGNIDSTLFAAIFMGTFFAFCNSVFIPCVTFLELSLNRMVWIAGAILMTSAGLFPACRITSKTSGTSSAAGACFLNSRANASPFFALTFLYTTHYREPQVLLVKKPIS
jgi:hypothetical protein